jgi:hypothetical protein
MLGAVAFFAQFSSEARRWFFIVEFGRKSLRGANEYSVKAISLPNLCADEAVASTVAAG